MRREIIIALRVTAVTLVLTGIIYPLAMTGVAQAVFHDRANGSLVHDDKGGVIGSELIGQVFTNPAYLQGRPSAAGNGYDATASSGSSPEPEAVTASGGTWAGLTWLKSATCCRRCLIAAIRSLFSGPQFDPTDPAAS